MDEWTLLLLWVGVPLSAIGSLVLYVWTLVNAAKNGKWVWFVLILLVWPFSIAYLLFADKRLSESRTPMTRRVDPH